jgi:DNA-binding response OmpR family regulator
MTDTFLIVDDDHLALGWLRQGIEKHFSGARVLTAANGRDGLEQLQTNQARVVITDLIMPGMDGFELITRIMSDYPDIPVIAVTGKAVDESQRLALKSGTLAVLFKPFKLQELCAHITDVFERQAEGGVLHNIAPSMFLQLVNLEQKTCTIRTTEKTSGRQGVLFFQHGHLLDARTGELQSEAAAYEIFSWEQISLVIQNSCPVKDRKIVKTLNALLLEAARRKDEESDDRTPSPPIAAEPVEQTETALPAADDSAVPADLISKLEGCAELKPHLAGIRIEAQWQPLLAALRQLGDHFQAGALRSAAIGTGQAQDVLILPADKPIAIRLDAKFPKDKVFALIESQ